MITDATYGEWLKEELNQRNLSPAKLAKMISKSRSVISRIIGEKNKVQDPHTCIAIARVFDLSPVTVLRIAKILPPEPNTIPLDDFREALAKLSPNGQTEVLAMAIAVAKTKQNLEKGNQAAGSH